MLEFAIIAQTDPDATTESASFFGFLGVACALVFASKFEQVYDDYVIAKISFRSWCCLWNS